jgi:hypothetical protein
MASILVAAMLTVDSVAAFGQPGGVGIGVGTFLITLNAAAFWGYVLSCHAFRHLAGGGLRRFSGHPVRHRMWKFASMLNGHHGLFALISLPLVMVVDAYVRLLAAGMISDPHFLLMRT